MEIIDYSEKAIVVRGEKTKECKEGLMQMGGKFNNALKGGAGWIFPKTKKEILEKFINEGVITKSEYQNNKSSDFQKKYQVSSSSKNEKIIGDNLIEKLESKIEELTRDISDLKNLIGMMRMNNKKPISQVKKEIEEKDFPEIVLEEEIYEEEEEEIKPKKKLLKKKE